jgi:hypothetical protein
MIACDPCSNGQHCVQRDLPEDGKCSCGTLPSPTPLTLSPISIAPNGVVTTAPVTSHTASPVVTPTSPTCSDSPLRIKLRKDGK